MLWSNSFPPTFPTTNTILFYIKSLHCMFITSSPLPSSSLHIWQKTCNKCNTLLVDSDLFSLNKLYSPVLFVFLQITKSHFSIWLSKTSYIHTKFSLCIHLSMDTQTGFHNLLLWMCCDEHVYMCHKTMLTLILWDKYQRLDYLDQRVVQFVAFWGTSKFISTVAALGYIPMNNVLEFLSLNILTSICYYLYSWCLPF